MPSAAQGDFRVQETPTLIVINTLTPTLIPRSLAPSLPIATATPDRYAVVAIDLVRNYLTRGHNEKQPESIGNKLAIYNVQWHAEQLTKGYLVVAIFPSNTKTSWGGIFKVGVWCVENNVPYQISYEASLFSGSGRFEREYPSMKSREPNECGIDLKKIEARFSP